MSKGLHASDNNNNNNNNKHAERNAIHNTTIERRVEQSLQSELLAPARQPLSTNSTELRDGVHLVRAAVFVFVSVKRGLHTPNDPALSCGDVGCRSILGQRRRRRRPLDQNRARVVGHFDQDHGGLIQIPQSNPNRRPGPDESEDESESENRVPPGENEFLGAAAAAAAPTALSAAVATAGNDHCVSCLLLLVTHSLTRMRCVALD
eukprot:CAMPEP_0172388820 /NCGR_PEP_ID=MMETSP1061-20121228/5841_1 /TAXON_ID=37318 /ORGANISM="Pseudo-nitzschia pungens, Strain cf. pungens" /LENGTH=205 /DNA_ID=CAMNT_0013118811 /DNA_START=446 /DNA_END=1060 /DNA_ORIENTATION=-